MNRHELKSKSSLVAGAIQRDVILRLPAALREGVTVFGGAIRDSFLGKDINDYDLMVADLEIENGLMSFLDEHAFRESVTPRHANYLMDGKKLQVLRGIHFPADAQAVAHLSDYTICCCAVTQNSIGTHVDFFSDLAERRLRLNRVSFPLATLERLQKFVARGFVADHHMILKLAAAIQQADLDNFDEVKRQLPMINQNNPSERRMEWPPKLVELQQRLFQRAYRAYLSQMRKSSPEFNMTSENYSPPEFEIEKKREEWVEIFARKAFEQGLCKSGPFSALSDLIDKSLKQFIYYPQGRETALFMTIEEIPGPEKISRRADARCRKIELPCCWPADHTLNVARYVGGLLPEELQDFILGNDVQLVLHNSDFVDAFAFQWEQGYSRAFAFKGDRGEVRGRVFIAVSDGLPPCYRLVAYQVRGEDSQKLYTEAIGPFFQGPALFVQHQFPAPISKFMITVADDLISSKDLVVVGYQNALWRFLSGPNFNAEWTREFLTTDGIEIDLFANGRTGQKLFSVRNMYGDEILEMLDLLWQKGCRRCVYLGSTGALDPEIEVGDLLMPTEFIGANLESFSFANGACEMPINAVSPVKVLRCTRQGAVATLIEETREKMRSMADLGIQAIDIETRYFAKFFKDRRVEASIILAVTDLPLGKTKLDEGYEINFVAVRSICQIFPALINS